MSDVPIGDQTWSNLAAPPLNPKALSEAWKRHKERLEEEPIAYRPAPLIVDWKTYQFLVRYERAFSWRWWIGKRERND